MNNDETEKLKKQITLMHAELMAQNLDIKALIRTHLGPEILREAFINLSEKSVSIALATSSDDGSIAAFEFFRDKWLEWLPPLPDASSKQPPKS